MNAVTTPIHLAATLTHTWCGQRWDGLILVSSFNRLATCEACHTERLQVAA